MPRGPGEIEYRSPEGEVFYGLPGIAVPAGWTQYGGAPDQPLERPFWDKLLTVAPSILGGVAGGVPGAMVGEAAGQLAGGEELDPGAMLRQGGAQALGTGIGKGASGLFKALSKLRIAGTGREADATRLGKAFEESVPSLSPIKPGAQGLEEVAGAEGKQRLSRAIGAGRGSIAKGLPDAPGVKTPRQTFTDLLHELSEEGTKGYTAQGVGRDTLQGVTARRSREEITQDILELLEANNPSLAAQFRQSQGMFSRGSEIQRALRPGKVLGTKGLDQGELQKTVGQRLKMGGQYDPGALKAIFRGGAPPLGDKKLAIPLGPRGMRIPLGLESLAGPGFQSDFGPGGGALMQALSQALWGQ